MMTLINMESDMKRKDEWKPRIKIRVETIPKDMAEERSGGTMTQNASEESYVTKYSHGCNVC